jgi:hypothetical protein
MYWMFLPPSANAGRHIGDNLLPRGGSWGAFLRARWDTVTHLFNTQASVDDARAEVAIVAGKPDCDEA